ncbi:MAG: hypothetical protein Q9225_006326 [Loekoesia sp. 1 TL-2023]
MSQQNRKLLAYLLHPNPKLDCKNCQKGGNTTSRYHIPPFPGHIKEWTDFKLSSLDAACGGLLKKTLECEFPLVNHPDVPEFPDCQIHDENCLTILLSKWNQSVVNRALEAVHKYAAERFSDRAVYMCPGGHGGGRQEKQKKGEIKLYPDWAGVFQSNNEQYVPRQNVKRKTVLPGETKLSSKWTVSMFQRKTAIFGAKATQNHCLPIAQIYTYCRNSNARYGYLITDQELVAVRIDEISPSPAGSKGAVSDPRKENTILLYKAIPWSDVEQTDAENSNSMTINLALLALHLVAARQSEMNGDPATQEEYTLMGESPDNAAEVHDQDPTTSTRNDILSTTAGNQDMSFRSETSDLRQHFSNASVGNDTRAASPPQSEMGRKRVMDEASEEERPWRRRNTRPVEKRF